jgi:hypothetical protein
MQLLVLHGVQQLVLLRPFRYLIDQLLLRLRQLDDLGIVRVQPPQVILLFIGFFLKILLQGSIAHYFKYIIYQVLLLGSWLAAGVDFLPGDVGLRPLRLGEDIYFISIK